MKTILLTASVVTAGVLTLVGCSGKAVTAASTPNKQDQMLKAAQCLRQHGLNVSDPQSGQGLRVAIKDGGQGTDKAKADAAMQACRKYMPGKNLNLNDPKVHDQMVKAAECMRQHGINVPDPLPGQPLQITSTNGSAAVDQAAKVCRNNGPIAVRMQDNGSGPGKPNGK